MDKFSKFGGIVPIERADTTEGAIPVTWEEFAQAYVAVEQALKFFDFAPLEERLRTATPLPLELSIAADIISGKLKRPAHRRADPMLQSRRQYLAFSVLAELEDDLVEQRKRKGADATLKINLKAAVAKVADDKSNRTSKTAVYEAVKAYPEMFVGYLSKQVAT